MGRIEQVVDDQVHHQGQGGVQTAIFLLDLPCSNLSKTPGQDQVYLTAE